MFGETFEYEDKQEKKDSFVEDKKGEDSAVDNKNQEKEGEKDSNRPKTKAEQAKDTINEWMRFLANDEPQDANPDKYPGTAKSGFSESFESELGGITEKKIPGYKRTLRDGREVEIVGGDDKISINISKGDGRNKDSLQINLSNFKKKKSVENNLSSKNQVEKNQVENDRVNNDFNSENRGNDENSQKGEKQENTMPQMQISGNVELLDKNLKPLLGEKSTEVSQDSNARNNYDVAKIVESIDTIIGQERQDVHGYEQKRQNEGKEKEFKKKEAYDLLLIETGKAFNENPPANKEIAEYVLNDNNFRFDNEGHYLPARKTFLALYILLRSYNNMQSIKEKILEQENVNTHKDATIKSVDSGENIAEYLSDNPLDLNFLIDNEEKVINLALNSDDISDEEKPFLQS